MTSKELKIEYVITKIGEKPKLCQIHNWDWAHSCHNVAGKHTITYLPADKVSPRRTDGDLETVHICDKCYRTFSRDYFGHLVNSIYDIQTAYHIVVH